MASKSVAECKGPDFLDFATLSETGLTTRPGQPEPDGFVPCIRLDRVNYSDGSHPQDFHTLPDDHWPAEPDGSGKSLTRVCFSGYGNDLANWQPASPTPRWAAPEE